MSVNRRHSGVVLSADFAHRVVERVRKAKRRRRLRRRVLICAAACGVAAFALLSLHIHNPPSPQPAAAVARRSLGIPSQWAVSSGELGQSANSGATVVSEPLAFFFPGATEVADFQSSGATYWHSYDPWWNPSP
jgi:hypothetical protein